MAFFHTLQNIIALPGIILFVSKAIRKQRRYMKKNIVPILQESLKDNDGSISSKNIQRITSYYGMAVPLIGEAYKRLMGEKLKEKERKSLNYMGALTCLFDDYFDEKTPEQQHIKALLNTPSLSLAQNDHERLFVKLYLSSFEGLNKEEYIQYAKHIHTAQVLSKEQTQAKLSPNELRHITQQKGGISILFYRFALNGEISSLEKEFFYDIGLLGQLENDIFDIYEDHLIGIHTLANTSKSMIELKQLYRDLQKKAYRSLWALDFPTRNKKRFMRLMSLILTRGNVCLNHYLKLDNSTSFNPANYPRELLICDMEKTENWLKWLKAYISSSY